MKNAPSRKEPPSVAQAIVVSRSLKKLQAALDAGADPNQASSRGDYPLHWLAGAKEQAPGMAAALVKAGARLEQRDKEGRTPLMMAAHQRAVEVCRELIGLGADVNAKGPKGSALHLAAMNWGSSKAEVLNVLLEAGADPNARGRRGWSFVQVAMEGEGELFIPADFDAKAEDDDGESALHTALMAGNEAAALRLLDLGADPVKPNGSGKTPTQLARERHCAAAEERIRSLMERDALGLAVGRGDVQGRKPAL